jgi:uncharacterized protein YeaO (DUF488 family)
MARARRPRPGTGLRRQTGRATRNVVSASTLAQRIAVKRVYEPAAGTDGTRVLIMRYWPRGILKERVDVWLRELAPQIPLLRAYLDGEITWAQYRPRYRAGLARTEAQAALAEVKRMARAGRVTLLCGCADPQRCHRTLLRAHLLDSGR